MNNAHDNNQVGSTRVVLISIVLLLLIVSIGYLFWSNTIKKSDGPAIQTVSSRKPSTSTPQPTKKSEVIILENNDMNKYINYRNKVEFLFPKKTWTYATCKQVFERRDYYGNWQPSDPYFNSEYGPVDMTVIESDDDYIITPKTTTLFSNRQGAPSKGYTYASCDVVPVTLELIREGAQAGYGAERSVSPGERKITIRTVATEMDIFNFAQELTKGNATLVEWQEKDDYRKGTIKVKEDAPPYTLGYAYDLRYYPSKKKMVFSSIGHSPWFQYPESGSTKSYFPDLLNTIKIN